MAGDHDPLFHPHAPRCEKRPQPDSPPYSPAGTHSPAAANQYRHVGGNYDAREPIGLPDADQGPRECSGKRHVWTPPVSAAAASVPAAGRRRIRGDKTFPGQVPPREQADVLRSGSLALLRQLQAEVEGSGNGGHVGLGDRRPRRPTPKNSVFGKVSIVLLAISAACLGFQDNDTNFPAVVHEWLRGPPKERFEDGPITRPTTSSGARRVGRDKRYERKLVGDILGRAGGAQRQRGLTNPGARTYTAKRVTAAS